MTLNPKTKKIIKREATVFLIIIAIAYILDFAFSTHKSANAGPYRPFWQDPYAYQVWNNSLRENAQIIRFLGYPFILLCRAAVWAAQALKNKKEKEEASLLLQGERIKKALEEIVQELNLDKKIESIQYNRKYQWYTVRFNPLPCCVIPKEYIDRYINSAGKDAKKELIDFLLTQR